MVKIHRQKETEIDPVLTRLAQEDTVPWYKKPNLRGLYFLLLPTCMGIEITSGFDSQLINALQITPSWKDYFHDPQSSFKGFIAASYALGAVLSLPIVPFVANRFGRRGSIMIGSLIQVVGAIVQGFSQHVAMYIVARCILGFGIPMCIVSGSSMIGELGHPKERPVLTSLFNVSYYIGSIVAAGICFGTNSIKSNWGWRIPSLLQIAPSIIQISCVYLIPESPRWLISKDRADEANLILIKYHGEGENTEFVRAEMAQITKTLELEYEAAKESWGDLLRSPGMRRRTTVTFFLGLFTQWSGNTLISYYLGDLLGMAGIKSAVTKQKINVGISGWYFICAIAAALLVKRFPRRVMFLTCCIAMIGVYTGWTVAMRYAVKGQEDGGINLAAAGVTMTFIFLYSPAYNIGYNALTYTYLVELWPFALRNRGIAFFQLWGRLANFFTTFVNPIGLANASWKYLIFYCCWLLVELNVIYFLFPETSGKTLEELAFLFEDKELADVASGAVEKVVHQHEENKTATA